MKKRIAICILMFTLMGNIVNAEISESFQKMLIMMNIPLQNIDGYEMNEEIYQKYQLLVYGDPKDISKNQRWKNVATGKWKQEETGDIGEYRILGYSYNGTVVNNEEFPDDYNSGISPEKWNYIEVEGALSSWNNIEKYQTQKQMEYMLTQNLSRNGVTYEITAQDIGLEKARIEAYATWKTAGSIFTLKRDSKGVEWGATFKVPPMAADAKLNAILNLASGEKYQWEEGKEKLEIPVLFGANVTNLGEYATQEEIQNISSELEVDTNIQDKVTGKNTNAILKDGVITINKNDYPNSKKIEVIVRNTSVLETCFHAEAPMVTIKEVSIEIVFEEEEDEYKYVTERNKKKDNGIASPQITSIALFRKNKLASNNKSPLWVAKKTNTPFISAGQVLLLEVRVKNQPDFVTFDIEGDTKIQTLDSLTQKFIYEEPIQRGEKTPFSSLKELRNMYELPLEMKKENGIYQLEYIIPYATKQTLHSWSTLRKDTRDSFAIDKNLLFSRITRPYEIKIKAKNKGGIVTKSILLDVFERWDTLYNREITEYVK